MRLRPIAFGMLLAGSLLLAAAPDAPGTAEGFWVATMPSGTASGELFVLAMNAAKTDGWLYLGSRTAE